MDGTSCAYIGTRPLVVNIGVISTNIYEIRKSDPGNTTIADVGDEAYATRSNAFGDVYLFAREGKTAVMVNVTVGAGDDVIAATHHIAGTLAQKALDSLLKNEVRTAERRDFGKLDYSLETCI